MGGSNKPCCQNHNPGCDPTTQVVADAANALSLPPYEPPGAALRLPERGRTQQMGIAEGAVQPLDALAKITDNLGALRAKQDAAARAARRNGASWATIGRMMGMSGEAARKRYENPRPAALTVGGLF